MNQLIGQVSYPVFVSGVFVFFIIASIFSFIVGVGLATRNAGMLRFFNFMNKSYSTRRMIKPLAKPLTAPHFVEPTLLKHPRTLGVTIVAGALIAIVLLFDVDDIVFQPMYSGYFATETAEVLAQYTHSFLLVGNAICILVGVMLLFFPHQLSKLEGYTDKWYSLRKQTRPLHEKYVDVDHWVMAHPTVAGVTLSLLSLGLGIAMYARI